MHSKMLENDAFVSVFPFCFSCENCYFKLHAALVLLEDGKRISFFLLQLYVTLLYFSELLITT